MLDDTLARLTTPMQQSPTLSAAQREELVRLLSTLQGNMAATLQAYPALQRLLPAMGYGPTHLADLEATLNATPCDTVIFGTPVDLRRLLTLRTPAVRVAYEIEEIGTPTLRDILPLLHHKAAQRLAHCGSGQAGNQAAPDGLGAAGAMPG